MTVNQLHACDLVFPHFRIIEMKLKRPPVIFNLIKNIGDQFAQLYRFLFQLEIPRQKFPQEILIFFIRDVLFVEIVFIDEKPQGRHRDISHI